MFIRFESGPGRAQTVECRSYEVETSLDDGLHKKVTLDKQAPSFRVGKGEKDWTKAYVMNSEGSTIEVIHAPSAKQS
jgi:hypothetical protein